MDERFEKIRVFLSELEFETEAGSAPLGDRDFSAMELPLIIQQIVDDLQSLLPPYEAAFYCFRHSVANNGTPHLRVGQRTIKSRVIKSVRGIHGAVSQAHVKDTLAGLESIGAIRKEGEPNRDGTLYRALIPDEIEVCRKFRAERAAEEPKPEIATADIAYYNVPENRIKVYVRDAYKCRYCEKQLTRFTATLDHSTPVTECGDNGLDNLVTACLNCNSRKHRRPVGDFLVEQ